MVILKGKTLAAAAIAFMLMSPGAIWANESVSGTLNAGGIFCFTPEGVLNSGQTFTIIGSAFDLSGNQVSVKWSIWHGPSPTNITTQLVHFQATSVNDTENGTQDYMQACINNNSSVTVSFSLQQHE